MLATEGRLQEMLTIVDKGNIDKQGGRSAYMTVITPAGSG